jgi:excisionase family DNA binding protein
MVNGNGNGKSMLSTRELARLLNVHINTVRRWSDQGILKSYRIGPRRDRRFSRDDVAVFLSENFGQKAPVNGGGIR